jgi:nucleotide-binding universal stress UspA family protein
MKHSRILVALNLTDGRDPAFERALAVAQTSGAELYLLHAVPANQPFSFRGAERLRRSAELRKRAEAAGVSAVTAEQHGDPAEIIVLHADARPVDFIVMSTERRTSWARFRQPSVAERVLRRTKRPTLVVPSNDAFDASAFEKVLIAVDLSPASRALIDSSMHLLGSGVRQMTALHAVDEIEAADALRNRATSARIPSLRAWRGPSTAEGRDASTRRHRRQADSSGRSRRRPGDDPRVRRYHNADLIVMGRTKRFMHLGSTAVRVLRNTDRAVLVIPPTAAVRTVDVDQAMYKRAA